MIKVSFDITYDKALTHAEQERVKEQLRKFLQFHIVSEVCKVTLDNGEHVRSQHLNVDGDIKVSTLGYNEVDHICPETGRIAMTVKDAYERGDSADRNFFLFYQDAHEMGVDPWRLIDGIDVWTIKPPVYTLDFVVGPSRELKSNDVVYMQRTREERMGK